MLTPLRTGTADNHVISAEHSVINVQGLITNLYALDDNVGDDG